MQREMKSSVMILEETLGIVNDMRPDGTGLDCV